MQAQTATAGPSSSTPWPRTVVACGALFVVYLLLSIPADTRGFLGTDTGGKVATIELMIERGDWDPDVEYWAASVDPEARFHGLIYTTTDGERYVNVTSLPMVLLARPLYALGGYRAALALPMIGGLLVALAARAMVDRLRGDHTDGWLAFWVVGLATPVVVYALDLWEHAIGLGLTAWALVLLVDAVRDAPTWPRAVGVGALFGIAGTMRTEALAYGAVTVAVAIGWRWWAERSPGEVVRMAVGCGGAVVVVLGAYDLLERSVMGSNLRAGRAAGAVSTGASELSVRAREAYYTLFGPWPRGDLLAALLGVGVVIAIVVVARRSSPSSSPSPILMGAAGIVLVVFLIRFADGPGFVPGLFVATPLAALGLAFALDDPARRLVAVLGVAPLPVVFAFQYLGGALPQWGGRYLLLSGWALAVVGLSARDVVARWVFNAVVVLSAAVSAFGVVWVWQRTNEVADAGERLADLDEPVLVAPNGFLPREFGAWYADGPAWLALRGDRDLDDAVVLLERAGVARFAVVVEGERVPAIDPAYEQVGSTTVPYLGPLELHVYEYERSATP